MNDDTRAAWVAAQKWHDTECLYLQLCCNIVEAAKKLIDEQAEEIARLLADWEMYLSEPHDVFTALREENARLRAALDILIAANEKHSDPRCGHCGYALADARAALRAPGQP